VFAEDIPHIVDATLTWLTNDWVSVGLEKVPSLPELQQEVLLMVSTESLTHRSATEALVEV
jgi:hypothetical protein